MVGLERNLGVEQEQTTRTTTAASVLQKSQNDLNQDGEDEEEYTVGAASVYLGVPRQKISRMIRNGDLPAIINPRDNRERIIKKSELDKIGLNRKVTRAEPKNPTTNNSSVITVSNGNNGTSTNIPQLETPKS